MLRLMLLSQRDLLACYKRSKAGLKSDKMLSYFHFNTLYVFLFGKSQMNVEVFIARVSCEHCAYKLEQPLNFFSLFSLIGNFISRT